MPKLFTYTLSLIILPLVALMAQPQLDLEKLTVGFDNLLDQHTKADRFQGQVVITLGGERVYTGANGYAHFPSKRTYTDTTRFAIASVTKVFTAAAILLLEQEEKLSLDDYLA